MSELVSIITPMYNAQKYIESTIASVQKQTYSNWEMIIVDDCSTDNSPDIVAKYAAEDNRIKYFRNKGRNGVAAARNEAMRIATGRYIAFLDSDDLWKPDKLQVQIEFMNTKGVHFCCTACNIIDRNGDFSGKIRYVPDKCDYKKLLKGNSVACLTVVIDRKYIQNMNMPSIPHEDYATWLDVCRTGETVYGINKVLASYRISNNSISNNKIKAATWTWNIYRNYLHISLIKSMYYFVCYVINAVVKRI